MTTTDYAKRLDACRDKWKWMPGMKALPRDAEYTEKQRASSQIYVIAVSQETDLEGVVLPEKERIEIVGNDRHKDKVYRQWPLSKQWVPDIVDPGTKGHLIAQIRERARVELSSVEDGFDWYILDLPSGFYNTEEETILIALEIL